MLDKLLEIQNIDNQRRANSGNGIHNDGIYDESFPSSGHDNNNARLSGIFGKDFNSSRVVSACALYVCEQGSIPAICSCLIIISTQSHVSRVLPVWLTAGMIHRRLFAGTMVLSCANITCDPSVVTRGPHLEENFDKACTRYSNVDLLARAP
jgi:hypothetical protein